MAISSQRDSGTFARVALLALFAATIAACAPLRDFISPAPGVPAEWVAFVEDVKSFERRIGFTETDNFLDFSGESEAYSFCGYASRLVLPYSSQDPAIQWRGEVTEQECRTLAGRDDVFFSRSEALGESGSSVNPAMIGAKLDRFLYLIIHEDCHDQFDLPYGVEEALCSLITYKAMAVFSDEKFGARGREYRAIRRHADLESERTRTTIAHYEQLAALYTRYDRRELSEHELMRARRAVLSSAERALAWKNKPLTNVGMANHMTYSRHYPYLERVHDVLGGDLSRTVAFFRQVDRLKPAPDAVMKRHRIASEKSLEFIRAYEAAVMETAEKLLAEAQPR